MDVLQRIMTGGGLAASMPGPADDFWYQASPGSSALPGLRVTAEGAKKISAWYRGRDLLATALAMLPLQVFERLPDDGGAAPARTHALYDVLHRKPGPGLDSFRWRRTAMYHLIDHGNAVAWILEGRRGFADVLEPFHPSQVRKVERIRSGPNRGRRLYHVYDDSTFRTNVHTEDEVFHLCGSSDDGLWGKGVLEYARDNMGTALATESYASRVFSHGSLSAGTITVPGLLDDGASGRMARSFKSSADDWHLPKVLEQGATWAANDGLTPEKAQMLLSRKFTIAEIARWLGLPPHMLGDLDRATFSNIEHQFTEFVIMALGPWLSLWEFAINDQLILDPGQFFAEFVRDALQRGDLAARWTAYQVAITTGTYTRNEVRRLENKPKLPGLDKPLDPAHLTGKPAAAAPKRVAPVPAEDDPADEDPADDTAARLAVAEAIAVESASRLLRMEVHAIEKRAVKLAADPDAWAAWVAEFYAEHVARVSQALVMTEAGASAYCAGQAAQVLGASGLAVLEQWSTKAYAASLASLALEEVAA